MLSWPELTGQYARKERAAQRENHGDLQRSLLSIQLSTHQCIQNYSKMGKERKE